MTASDVVALVAVLGIGAVFVVVVLAEWRRRGTKQREPMNCEGCPFPIAGDCDRPCDQAEQ